MRRKEVRPNGLYIVIVAAVLAVCLTLAGVEPDNVESIIGLIVKIAVRAR